MLAAVPKLLPVVSILLCALSARAETLVAVTDPAALKELEGHGLSLGERLGDPAATSGEALARGAHYQALAATIKGDVAALGKADPRSGVGVARFSHRLFDGRWLGAAWTRFELIGVTNRLDRKPFATDQSCGDTRFIYRLAYTRDEGASRLPMTITVDYRAGDDCAEAARRWQAPAAAAGGGEALATWLRGDSGPLAARLLDPARLTLVQVNLQAVRWPSAVRPDMAAHAEYLLRAFRPGAGGELVPGALDNMPDVARLRKDKALRAELLAWLRAPERLDAIDEGAFVLPAKFLAQKALSISPRGLARRANRPFLQIFSPAELADLPLKGRRAVGSPAAFLRRLDDASCVGCHQARAVAGFHFLGVEGSGAEAANALALAGSPHFFAELDRRRRLTDALAGGGSGNFYRPLSERADSDPGGYGAHCGLGDDGFARWTCAGGLGCQAYDAPLDDGSVGVCLPPSPRVGDPCEVGRIRAAADAHRDRVAAVAKRACSGDAYCDGNSVGFPGGMCTTGCGALDGDSQCGKIAVLRGFNDCLARREPFARCLADNVTPAALRACDDGHPCRDDYICAGSPGARGTCIPPYFLFQMRVDGHP